MNDYSYFTHSITSLVMLSLVLTHFLSWNCSLPVLSVRSRSCWPGISSYRWPIIHRGSMALTATFGGPVAVAEAEAEAEAMIMIMKIEVRALRLHLLGENEYLHNNNKQILLFLPFNYLAFTLCTFLYLRHRFVLNNIFYTYAFILEYVLIYNN